ncbi:hypothetical protein [Dielma fastidiosa]|uniref:hypothetical protein n=1 Tax=Dielma fastidiosa TaxID=1034346 RepID=UPI000E48C427|nr:hypothetical protein [Dielma fastidiosa]RHM97865.1 hypothetical protein DWZ33_15015 [Dielma fastidiosa]
MDTKASLKLFSFSTIALVVFGSLLTILGDVNNVNLFNSLLSIIICMIFYTLWLKIGEYCGTHSYEFEKALVYSHFLLCLFYILYLILFFTSNDFKYLTLLLYAPYYLLKVMFSQFMIVNELGNILLAPFGIFILLCIFKEGYKKGKNHTNSRLTLK